MVVEKKKLVNRTKVKNVCDAGVPVQYVPPKKLVIHYEQSPDIDFPDYEHYNYAYECAYDIEDIQLATTEQARAWYSGKKKKRTNNKISKVYGS